MYKNYATFFVAGALFSFLAVSLSEEEVFTKTESGALTTPLDARQSSKRIQLRFKYDESIRATAAAYWRSQHHNAKALELAKSLAKQEIVDELGAEAIDDPLFRSLYYPFDPLLSGVSSEKQLAVKSIILNGNLERSRQLLAGKLGASRTTWRNIDDAVREVLTTEEYQRYLVEVSSLSRLLSARLDEEDRLTFESIVLAFSESESLLSLVQGPVNGLLFSKKVDLKVLEDSVGEQKAQMIFHKLVPSKLPGVLPMPSQNKAGV